MTKQSINVGTSANDRKGDSLRAAFVKVNANFTELYTALGLADTTLNLGAFTFTGSTMSTDDSTNIVIDKPITVNGEIIADGDIVPKTNLGSSLGTPTRQWKSLYVSTNTIYLGGVPLTLDASNNLTVNGSRVGATSYTDLSGKPALTTVATTGAYADLTGKPTIPTSFSSLVNGAYTASLGSDGVLTIPPNGLIIASTGPYGYQHEMRLGDGLSIGQGGSLANYRNETWTLYGQNSDAGTQIRLPGQTDSDNGMSLLIQHQYANSSIDIESLGNIWSFRSDGLLTFPDGTTQSTAPAITIAADDSTQRTIYLGEESIKFIGAGGVTTASDAEGNITITGSSTYTLPTATTSVLGGVKVDGTSVTINNGIISLNAGLSGSVTFKGGWDANTNTPTIGSLNGTTGWMYIVTVGGTRDLTLGAGPTTYAVNDLVIYDGTDWILVTGNNGVLSFNTRTGAVTLTSTDVTTALGFTPYSNANPSGYITGINSGAVTTALGFTPYNSTNPSNYISSITSGNVTTALGFTPYSNANPSNYITTGALTVSTAAASGAGSLSYSAGVFTFTPAAAYTLPTATTGVLGGVKIDNSTIVISSGVISVSSALTSAVQFKGNWDASANTPALSNTLPAGVAAGWEYIVSVGATRDIGNGSTAWSIGDLVIYDGAKWVRIPSGNSVTAFNTRQGSITLTSSDVTTALASTTANYILAAPNGSAGTASFRAAVIADISNLGTGVATFLATPTSANLASAITDETGTSKVLFSTSPTVTTSLITDSASFDLVNTTATTVNFAGAATTLSIGAASGTASINNVTLTLGNATAINVNGVSPTIASTSTGTLTLFNANLLTVNFANAATTVTEYGAATSLAIGNVATAAQTVNMFTASTGASTYNFATGATLTATTKAINIGTTGVSGSTTNIAIGSTVSGAIGTTTIGGATLTVSTPTAVNLGTSTGTATTATIGGAITGNTLKVAGTAVGTVNLTTDVTSGTVNAWQSVTGTINFGSTGNIFLGTGTGAITTVKVGGAIDGNILKIAGTTSGTTSAITTDVTTGTFNMLQSVTGTVKLGASGIVQLGTSTSATTTVQVGGAVDGNILKIAGTTTGTTSAITTDVTTGTVSVFNTGLTGILNIGSLVGATNIATGATASGSTKTISIGTTGTSGSTTNIAIGSTVSGATSTLTFGGSVADATATSTSKSVGYLGLPQSATATTATLAIGDAGKHIYITTTAQTITIPANASVAYPIGTTITFIAGPSATTATIAIATDTLRLAGGTSTGNRTLAANGMATAVKVAATTWYINGTGLT